MTFCIKTRNKSLAKISKTLYDERVRKGQVTIAILFLVFVLSLFSIHNTLAFSCVPKVTVDASKGFNTIVNFGSIAPNVSDKDWLLIDNQKISGELTANRDLIFQIGKLSPGDYPFNQQTNNAIVCRGTITVPDLGQGGSTTVNNSGKGEMEILPPTPTGVPSPCAEGYFKDGKCTGVNTAIGIINTEPQAFVKRVFSLVLGLAGGIALVLIMVAGYRFMASQGNPEQVQAARDQLTSAVVGLLFIIFSFVILEVIGVDILKIPGFQP